MTDQRDPPPIITWVEAAISSFEGTKHEVIYTLANAANVSDEFARLPRKKLVALFLGMHFDDLANAFDDASEKYPEYAELAHAFSEQLRQLIDEME